MSVDLVGIQAPANRVGDRAWELRSRPEGLRARYFRLKNGSGQGDSRSEIETVAKKKPGPKSVPALVLAGCPDKLVVCAELQIIGTKNRNLSYALRRGRIVKSRTWVRMLDICIPFSCETNGSNSAIN